MAREIHPDMRILQEAQKVAYGGSGIEGIRASWTAYTRSLAQPHPSHLIVRDAELPVPGHPVPVRIYQHPKPSGAGIIYMHGGGFMKGDLDSSDPIAWGFCDQTGATVISVDYRLTPEHPFPAAFDDCCGVLGWAATNAVELKIDPARIALVGDSAGGQLAAGLCLAARDRGGPPIKAQVPIYTVIGSDMEGGSYDENATGYGLTTEYCRSSVKLLLTEPAHWANPYARPFLAESFAGMPPAFVLSAELDPVRDDGRTYAARLALAGVDVTYREARGMLHGFMRARFTGSAARAEYDGICAFLRERV